ncbi:MAG: sensor histidine kinase, partial [Dehalococcoidia bacterium]
GIQFAPVIENIRLYHQARRQAYQLRQLNRTQHSGIGYREYYLQDSTAIATDTRVRLDCGGPNEEGDRYNCLQPGDSMGRELLVDAAHALRSPLAAIKGYCSALLQSDVTWPPELSREFLETIDEETEVLNLVVGELLAPTGGDAGLIRLVRVESTAQVLLDKAGRMMAEKSQSIPVEFRCSGDQPTVLVDPARIVQVISHLARRASQPAGPGSGVVVECSCPETTPEIVIGTGDMGVDGNAHSQPAGADKTASVASPELRLEEDLRVSICQSLLEAHGVRLEIGPWKGRPGLFRFLLPLAPARDPWVLANT